MDRKAYGLMSHVGGLEVVSAKEIEEHGEDEKFFAEQTEAKLAGTANWAQETFAEQYTGDTIFVLVTLCNVEGVDVYIPEQPRSNVPSGQATFNTDLSTAWPAKIPIEPTTPAESYDQLANLFSGLWTDAGIGPKVFYQDGSDAISDIRDFN